VGPRRGELLALEWPDEDLKRKEFTLRKTKNDELRTMLMMPAVYQVFVELWKDRRLDTTRVFLYKGKLIHRIGTAFRNACLGLHKISESGRSSVVES